MTPLLQRLINEGAPADVLEAVRDAVRYDWLKQRLTSAIFNPSDPDGLDLDDDGVALIFLVRSNIHVYADLDKTIDAAMQENSNDH